MSKPQTQRPVGRLAPRERNLPSTDSKYPPIATLRRTCVDRCADHLQNLTQLRRAQIYAQLGDSRPQDRDPTFESPRRYPHQNFTVVVASLNVVDVERAIGVPLPPLHVPHKSPAATFHEGAHALLNGIDRGGMDHRAARRPTFGDVPTPTEIRNPLDRDRHERAQFPPTPCGPPSGGCVTPGPEQPPCRPPKASERRRGTTFTPGAMSTVLSAASNRSAPFPAVPPRLHEESTRLATPRIRGEVRRCRRSTYLLGPPRAAEVLRRTSTIPGPNRGTQKEADLPRAPQ